jgi:thiol-disulfide isomerase/thioredoxin
MPIEVWTVSFYGTERGRREEWMVRRNARYNVPVDPASWTLAGLNMPAGTEVVDYRTHRGLGYWNGTGLSENPPPGQAQATRRTNSINLPKLKELAATEPESLFAAHVYFTEAYLRKRDAAEGVDERQSAEIEGLLQRTISASRPAGPSGLKMLNLADEELSQLRSWGLGRVSPEIEGEGMDGQKMKLSDCRGKIVVLVFWATWCPPCMAMVPDERKLVARMAGKPFALLGINADDPADQAKVRDIMDKNKMSWPSFRDGRNGPIASAWKVRSWPTIYVLDAKGTVRYRNVRGQALVDAVDALTREGM